MRHISKDDMCVNKVLQGYIYKTEKLACLFLYISYGKEEGSKYVFASKFKKKYFVEISLIKINLVHVYIAKKSYFFILMIKQMCKGNKKLKRRIGR